MRFLKRQYISVGDAVLIIHHSLSSCIVLKHVFRFMSTKHQSSRPRVKMLITKFHANIPNGSKTKFRSLSKLGILRKALICLQFILLVIMKSCFKTNPDSCEALSFFKEKMMHVGSNNFDKLVLIFIGTFYWLVVVVL